MRHCWELNAAERPTFGDLITNIEEFLTELMSYFDFDTGEEPLPPDPYMNWTQQLQAQDMEVEEQADRERRDLEMQAATDQGVNGLEPIAGDAVTLVVNLDVDRESSPRYLDSVDA